MRRFIVPVLAASLLCSACFGSFKATGAVWKFNDEVSDNKWVDEIVFVGLALVQVYTVAMAADALVINSIEFWTGSNPIASNDDPASDAAVAEVDVERNEDGSLTLRGPDRVIRIEQNEAGLQAMDATGEVIATAHRVDGALVVVDSNGARTISADALADVAARGPVAARELALRFAGQGALCAAR